MGPLSFSLSLLQSLRFGICIPPAFLFFFSVCPKTRAFLEICHFFFTPRTFVVKPGEKKTARLVANKKSNDRRIKAGLDITKGRLRHLKVHSLLLLLLLLLLLMLLLSVVCSRRVGGDIPTAHSSTPQLVLRPS